MSTIPLYNNGETPKAPRAVPLARIPTPERSVDYQRLGAKAADAYEQPTLPRDWGRGDVMAKAAWGEALQNVGGMLTELSIRTAQVKNAGDVANAENVAMQAIADYQLSLTPDSDPATWVSGLAKVRQGLDKQFSNGKFSPAAANQIRANLDRLMGRTAINISFDAQRRTIERSKQNISNLVTRYTDEGNYGAARQAVKQFGTSAGMVPEEVDAAEYQIVKRQTQAEQDNLVATQPRLAIDFLNEKPENRPEALRGLSPAQEREVRDKAFASMFEQKRELIALGSQMIASGEVRNVDDIGAFVKSQDPNMILDQADYNHLKGVLEGSAPKNTDEAWNRAYRAIQSFDATAPDEVKRKREAEIRMGLEVSTDGPVKAELNQMLDERLKDVDDLRAQDLRMAADALEREKKRGAFGPITRPKTNEEGLKLAKKEKTLVIPEKVGESKFYKPWTWFNGDPRPGAPEDAQESEDIVLTEEADPEGMAKAEAKEKEILRAFDKWVRDNPAAPQDEKLKKLNELMGGKISAGDADAFLRGGVQHSSALFPSATDSAKILKNALNAN